MNKLLVIFALMFSLWQNSNAQEITGYLGKKNIFLIGGSAAPAWWNFPYHRKNDVQIHYPEGKPKGLTRLNFAYDRVVGQTQTLGVYASFFNNQFPGLNNQYIYNTGESYSYSGTTNHEASYSEIGLQMKFFQRNNAPLGRYFAIKAGIVTAKYEVDLKEYITESGISYSNDIMNESNSGMRLGMVFGSNRIIKNRIMIDYGLEFGFLASPIKSNAYIFTDTYRGDYETLEESINELAMGGAATNGFLLLNLNIGYVL